MRYMMLIHHDENDLGGTPDAGRRSGPTTAPSTKPWPRPRALRPASGCSRRPRQRPSASGAARPTCVDGPYADTKEQFAGYFFIEAADLDEAIDWAERCPASKYGAIEIRPIVPSGQVLDEQMQASREAERVARESYGRLVAFLAARTRDVAGAEDALAEAFATALASWPEDGVPHNPDAWLLTVARRRQTDAMRRRQTRTAGEEHLMLIADEIEAAADDPEAIPDRRLALMFACAHPAIERGMRAPLILQTILGLTAEDIAAAFLDPARDHGPAPGPRQDPHQGRRHSLRRPRPRRRCAERLDAVLEAIYAAYAKGWARSATPTTPPLADEAIWLGRLVVSLLPDEPEAKGMLALMLYAEARRPARRERRRRLCAARAAGHQPLGPRADRGAPRPCCAPPTPAAPPAATSSRPPSSRPTSPAASTGIPNWAAIVALYDHLLALTRSPVVALNRAVALAEIEGPAAASAALEPLAARQAHDRLPALLGRPRPSRPGGRPQGRGPRGPDRRHRPRHRPRGPPLPAAAELDALADG